MTPIDISLRVLDAEDLARSRVLVSARIEGIAAPVLAAGAMGDIRALLDGIVPDALAEACRVPAPEPVDLDEAAGEADDAAAATESLPAPAGRGGDAGQLTLLAFDF